MHRVIAGIVDADSFTEVHAHFARNVICGFARVEGRSVGIVAQQPEVLAGVLDIDSSDKAARFVRFCDCFNIPVVTLVDVPGFLPGVDQEHRRHHPPRRQAPLRLLRGDGSEGHGHHPQGIRRCLRRHEQQARARRPELRVAHRRDRGDGRRGRGEHHLQGSELAKADDPEAERARLVAEYEERLANPYVAAARGYVDEVILPSETRARVAMRSALLAGKRQSVPAKKHGNIRC